MKNLIYIFVLCTGLQAQVNLNSSLTACYALNGNGTEPINTLTGTLVGAVAPTVDRFNNPGSALYFPGTTFDFVKLPNDPLLKPSNDISLSVWVKPDILTTMELIYTKNIWSSYFSAYALTFQPAAWPNTGYVFRGYRQDGWGDNTVDATTSITSPGSWYHVVLTIDNNQMQMYVNGVLENTTLCTITNYNYQSGKEVILGGTNEWASNPPFKGSMDNLRFYNRVINAQEASALYNQDPPCIASGSPPDPGFSASSNTICVRDTVYLNDMSTNSPTSWQWSMTGGNPASSTLNNPFVVYNIPGTYTISLIATNQFGPSTPVYQTITVIDCDQATGLSTQNLNTYVKISPNPCREKLWVNLPMEDEYTWELCDVTGRTIRKGVLQRSTEIDLSAEEKGLYFLVISNKLERSVTKILKQ